MLTRSAAKRLQAQTNPPLNVHQPQRVGPSTTLIEITVSETGLGSHIRWKRPEAAEPSVDTIDPRFITPAPQSPKQPNAPRKSYHQQRRLVDVQPLLRNRDRGGFLITIPPGADDHGIKTTIASEIEKRNAGRRLDLASDLLILQEVERQGVPSLQEEDEDMGSSGQRGSLTTFFSPVDGRLGSPFDDNGTEPRRALKNIRIKPRELYIEYSICGGTSDVEAHRARPWGLGPCGTVLVGTDGRAINSELEP